jgi:alcohol dehydrogenase, propanol-preferring
MRAMVLAACAPMETAPLRLMEWPDPSPLGAEIRVRVKACGICRTDLHIIEGELPSLGQPIVPGHQIVGEVDALGPEASRFPIGERVGIAWLRHTCGHCVFCRSGKENLCESSRFTGYHSQGGFAEYAAVSEAFAYAIPDTFSDIEAAPLLCAGIIGYRSLQRSGIQPGGRLALYGFGASAHIVIQIALFWACEVYVCSRQKKHQELAVQLGAKWAGSRPEEMPVEADSAIIFAPAGSLVPQALARLRKGGTLALAGIYMTAIPEMDYKRHLFYEKDVHSVTANTRQDALELLELAARIPIRPKVREFPLAQANEALLKLKRDEINGAGVLVP